ncbi:MAG: hypothetical protein JNK82_25125 [Myxococcaceae bacterium]|nr:hypothetical protein [Myxococcaceae bacterium]
MKKAAKGKKPAAAKKGALARRDTPVDVVPVAHVPVPHVTAPRPLGPPKVETSELALRSETIEAAYETWQEHREHHRAALTRLEEERRKLEQQGEFVLGAVRAARDASGPQGEGNGAALAAASPLDAYLTESSQKLEQAKRELEAAASASAAKWEETFARIRAEVRVRVQRQLALVKPRLVLRVRALAGDKRILHVDRPGPDEAVLLCFLFTGRLPSRYGYLFDDSTDDLRESPPTLYAEEGVLPAHVRPDAHALEQLLETKTEALPLKGMLPMRLPSLLRLIERGPIMEAEVADGVGFRNVLSRDEAERIAGQLLKMKLEGWIQLDLLAE